MNILELMDSKVSSFSKTDRKIYEAVKKFPESFAKDSITEISNNSGFTKPALTRFAQKLGFNGYTEFQYQFNLDKETLSKKREDKSLGDIYAGIIKRTEETIKEEDLKLIIEKFKQARAIYIKGANLSRLPAEELHIALSLNSPFLSIIPEQDIPPTSFQENDVVIVYSAQAGSSHQDLCKRLRNKELPQPYSILVTTNAKHPLRHNFSHVVVLPSISLSVGKNAVLSDTFSFLYFNECLIQKLNEK